MTGVMRAEVTVEVLDTVEHERLVASPRSGAVVSFAGVVREHDHGRDVDALNYESHPAAGDVLREVAEEIAKESAVNAVAVSHRIGPLRVGDVALAAAVSCAHRGEAFDACRRLVDEVKARLPIWKHQEFSDGTDEWVNCP
jgi:molybdopterin synthase catalytic subunit